MDELSKILIELLTSRSSNFIWFLIAKKRYSNNAFTHALIAVATAMPISLIDPIKSSDNTTLVITLTMDMYSGVLVSSLAKKQETKTLIIMYAGKTKAK